MTLGPRAKLLLVMGVFALPIVASLIAYQLVSPGKTTNYGELIAPSPVTTQRFGQPGGGDFTFQSLAGRWILIASDSGRCDAACREKLTTLRQVRLALGRKAIRVERVFVVDDLNAPTAEAMREFEGTRVAVTPPGMALPPGAGNDRAHIYLVDPNGNVMMRWPAGADRRRMVKDLERLLKASQIG